MKLTALSSLKFLKLKRRLSLPHWQCVGLLESIWLFTQSNAIAGDIGRHSDEDIAAGIEWEGEATELIDTLVQCRLLDRCPTHRLIVHGWEKHAPTYLKGAISRHGLAFAKHAAKQDEQQDAKHDAQHESSQTASKPNLTNSCLALPNQTQPATPPNPPKGGTERVERPRNLVFDALTEVSGLDPKTAGKRIGTAAATLTIAGYSPDEIREFGKRFWELCAWAKDKKRTRPTPHEIATHIGLLRSGPGVINGDGKSDAELMARYGSKSKGGAK